MGDGGWGMAEDECEVEQLREGGREGGYGILLLFIVMVVYCNNVM